MVKDIIAAFTAALLGFAAGLIYAREFPHHICRIVGHNKFSKKGYWLSHCSRCGTKLEK